MGEFLKVCDSQFANANKGRGVNVREKIVFVRNALEKNGVRRNRWELKMKELRREGTLTADPAKAYEVLLADLRNVIPEAPLELRLRKKNWSLTPWSRGGCPIWISISGSSGLFSR